MTAWNVSDGTRVSTGHDVITITATTYFGATLVDELPEARVDVGLRPGGTVALDQSSDYLVDLWVRARAARAGLTVISDFVPDDSSVPDAVRELLAAQAAADDPDDGSIY